MTHLEVQPLGNVAANGTYASIELAQPCGGDAQPLAPELVSRFEGMRSRRWARDECICSIMPMDRTMPCGWAASLEAA